MEIWRLEFFCYFFNSRNEPKSAGWVVLQKCICWAYTTLRAMSFVIEVPVLNISPPPSAGVTLLLMQSFAFFSSAVAHQVLLTFESVKRFGHCWFLQIRRHWKIAYALRGGTSLFSTAYPVMQGNVLDDGMAKCEHFNFTSNTHGVRSLRNRVASRWTNFGLLKPLRRLKQCTILSKADRRPQVLRALLSSPRNVCVYRFFDHPPNPSSSSSL